jgi:N-methylhydantoinase A
VGAGGGSIAHVPMTGAIRVGPESAGAFPGPACYGKGGTAATVTDANVVLGRLPESLLGGRMPLDTKAAEDVVGALGHPLNLDLYETAQGIIDIVNENMFGALRLTTVQRGLDLRNFSLVPFGGAGPLHANALAMLGQCYPIIVPLTPGVLSALGFLNSSIRHEASRTLIRNLDDIEPNRIEQITSQLENKVGQWLKEEGIALTDQAIRYEIDLRYLPQGHELSLMFQVHDLENNLQTLRSRFDTRHQELYGFQVESPVEIVNLRVIGIGQVADIKPPKMVEESPDASAAMTDERPVYFDKKSHTTAVYERNILKAGNEIAGPALISQTDSTTLVHPDHLARIDEYLNLVISPITESTQATH